MALQTETKRAGSLFLWSAILVVLVLAGLGIRYYLRERVTVRVAHVTYQDLTRTIPTIGKVQIFNEFQAYAPAPGIVQEIYVTQGEQVKPGQLLLRMDDADARARLATAQSLLRAQELALANIKRGGSQEERNTASGDMQRQQMQREQDAASLAALQQLQQKGAASTAEVAAAKQRLDSDDSMIASLKLHGPARYDAGDLGRAEAAVADARASVDAAQSALAHLDIRSPIAGTAYSIPVAQYDFVPAGQEGGLVYVADLNHVEVHAYFDEPEIGSLAEGQPVKITWEAKPGVTWHGHITHAPSTVIAYGTRNVGECIIAVDDSRGDLEPNANVNVVATVSQHTHVLSVPREALHTEGLKNYVYRVVDGSLVRTDVQVGIFNLTYEEITGGLTENDIVALGATTNRELSNGLEVTPVQ